MDDWLNDGAWDDTDAFSLLKLKSVESLVVYNGPQNDVVGIKLITMVRRRSFTEVSAVSSQKYSLSLSLAFRKKL